MAFRSKTTLKKRSRSQPLSERRSTLASPKPASALARAQAQKTAMQKATIRALEKARREAEAAGLCLSQWETDFIEGVSERVRTFGRAFADPDKGAMNGTLSLRQGLN